MKKYIFVAICSLAVLLWIGFIWSNSAQTGEESGETSSQVQEVINEIAESIGIEEPISEHTVRKSAHFTEYLVLALLICIDAALLSHACFVSYPLHTTLLMLSALPMGFAVALVDEFLIQASTDGRGPSFTDVLIDLGGAAVGALLSLAVFFAVYTILRRTAIKREKITEEN